MPSPFPGMDPYLETPLLWRDVHSAIVGQIQTALNPKLRPHYVARVELRVYISDEDDPGREAIIPDVRVETTRRRNKGARPKDQAAVSVLEPIILPLLLDDEIEEARVEI